MNSPRVVSLIASATETVCALGAQAMLVGRSHECDYPESVKALPPCTEPKFPVEGSSYEIDQRVKAVLQEGLSVYRVFADTLRELKPDVILTQSQCEVCAVSLRDVEQAICDWTDREVRVVSLEPNRLSDVWRDFQSVADALRIPERGHELVDRIQNEMDEIANKTAALDHRPSVAAVEWIEPLMAAGNWIPELIEMAGGKNLFGQPGKHSPWLEWQAVVQADPDIVVVHPCGFDIPRTIQEIPLLQRHPEWSGLTAVRNGQVYVTDGNQYFNRPGPRLLETLQILAQLIHPDHFAYPNLFNAWTVV